MQHSAILLPCAALVLLSALVWLRLYFDRLREMYTRRIRPQDLASARELKNTLQNTQASDNFSNLFEVPVQFYALCLALAVTNLDSHSFVYAAWVYVALRSVHSIVHLTSNFVPLRFFVYIASTLLLYGMWAGFALNLLS